MGPVNIQKKETFLFFSFFYPFLFGFFFYFYVIVGNLHIIRCARMILFQSAAFLIMVLSFCASEDMEARENTNIVEEDAIINSLEDASLQAADDPSIRAAADTNDCEGPA